MHLMPDAFTPTVMISNASPSLRECSSPTAEYMIISISKPLEADIDILISDGGGQLRPEEEPERIGARHSYRVPT
jgi:hypothetical protein